MLVLGKSRTPAARAGRRSLESFPLLKEVIGEREVRRKEEGEEEKRQQRKVATRKV